jgi:Protein of unknown function (DUF3109)
MLVIDNVLISDEVVEKQFVCDLAACKGGCCVDGDAGAPLEENELEILEEIYGKVKTYLNKESIAEIEKRGLHVYEKEYGHVTPTINHKICVYGVVENGIVKCGIEKAYNDGKINFKKPISCHLYPIRIESKTIYDAVNYEPREILCKPACRLGKRLKVPVYQFLKEAIIRKYGQGFFDMLDKMAKGDYEITA